MKSLNHTIKSLTHKALLIIAVLTLTVGFAQESNGKDVIVTIENIKNNRGHLIIALHSEDTFMKAQGLQTFSEKISDNKMVVTFKNVPSGHYAVMVLHDENDNKSMDFEPNGMPSESYAISNNPVLMGPPTFNDGKFEVKEEAIALAIKL